MRVCGNCGQPGHNSRTCTNATVAPATPATPKKQKKCGKCGGMGHNARTCDANNLPPDQLPQTVSKVLGNFVYDPDPDSVSGKKFKLVKPKDEVESAPEVVANPTSKPTVANEVVHGVDVSGLPKENIRGQVRYTKKNGNYLIFPQINVTRQEQFEKVVAKIKETIKIRKEQGYPLTFKVKEIDRKVSRVPHSLYNLARRDLVPGAFEQKGIWYWEQITYQIEHSEFEDPNFEYIGEIVMEGGDLTGSGNWEFTGQFYDRTDSSSPKALGGSKAHQEFSPLPSSLYATLRPDIEKMQTVFKRRSDILGIEKFPSGQKDAGSKKKYGGSCICFKCNPDGDKMWRSYARLYMATKDVRFKVGRLGSEGKFVTIKKGTLIPLGDGCEYAVNPIDIELIASLYGASRIKSERQNEYQPPFSRAGYNWKEMAMRDYLKRVFAYYGKLYATVVKSLEEKSRIEEFELPLTLITQKGITYESARPFFLQAIEDKVMMPRRSELVKVHEGIKDKVFPRTASQQRAGAKGIYNPSKAGFLLESRYFELNGKHYLQPVRSKKGGIQDYYEEFENQQNNPDFFEEIEEFIYNEDGLPIVDQATGEPLTQFIKVPNDRKLEELFGYSGGIKLIDDPQKMDKEVNEAIEWLKGLDVNNLPSVLENNFKTSDILNSKALLVDLNAVGKEGKSNKVASQIWQMWTANNLEKRKNLAYERYEQRMREQAENKYGFTVKQIDLPESVVEKLDRLPMSRSTTWDTKFATLDPATKEYLLDLEKRMKTVKTRDRGKTKQVLYVDKNDTFDESEFDAKYKEYKVIQAKFEDAEQVIRKLEKAIFASFSSNGGNYWNTRRSYYDVPSRNLEFENKEMLEQVGVSSDLSNDELLKEMKTIGSSSSFESNRFSISMNNGQINKLLITTRQFYILDEWFRDKELAMLGVAPSTPTQTAVNPTQTTTQATINTRLMSSELDQLERDLRAKQQERLNSGIDVYLPANQLRGVKGYIYSISPKKYNAPSFASPMRKYGRDIVYVGMITSNNSDTSMDLYYLNFPYPASLLDNANIRKGTFVELTGDVSNKGDSEWYGRYQSAVYVRDENLRKG